MTAAVFQGEFAEFKTVKTRGVVQFIIEVPVVDGDRALKAAGGLPIPGETRWVAVALLGDAGSVADAIAAPVARIAAPVAPAKLPPTREPRRWRELHPSQQAGMLCMNPEFVAWVGAADNAEAAAYVRTRCGISSRSELDRNPVAADVWAALSRAFFIREDTASQEAAYRERQ